MALTTIRPKNMRDWWREAVSTFLGEDPRLQRPLLRRSRFQRRLKAGVRQHRVPAIARLGITVNAVDPGPSDTGWMGAELREALITTAPMGRIGLPQDAARLIAFLASDEAGWITGQVIRSRGAS